MHSRQPLGQHFLIDVGVLQTILAAAELKPQDIALEIGPGRGILTDPLAKQVAHLTTVELDRNLAERLTKIYAARSNISIHQGDFLRSDLDALFPAALGRVKILGNLPYAITSPIFEKLLAWPRWDTGVFLVQWEVAERMQSAPGSRAFGILSLAIQLFADVQLICEVGPEAFKPPPRVRSAVIRLRRHASPRLALEAQPAFFDLAHAAFAHRRKTLLNSLVLETHGDKKKVEEWLRANAVNPTVRAETLGVDEYARLSVPWSIFRREIEFDNTGDNV